MFGFPNICMEKQNDFTSPNTAEQMHFSRYEREEGGGDNMVHEERETSPLKAANSEHVPPAQFQSNLDRPSYVTSRPRKAKPNSKHSEAQFFLTPDLNNSVSPENSDPFNISDAIRQVTEEQRA
ncbi:hypothetical protein Hanom_Chr15g01401351 [Helianthus anomalus]